MKSAWFCREGSLVPMGWADARIGVAGEHPPIGLGRTDFSKSSCSLFPPRELS